jgi:hypothetical protein
MGCEPAPAQHVVKPLPAAVLPNARPLDREPSQHEPPTDLGLPGAGAGERAGQVRPQDRPLLPPRSVAPWATTGARYPLRPHMWRPGPLPRPHQHPGGAELGQHDYQAVKGPGQLQFIPTGMPSGSNNPRPAWSCRTSTPVAPSAANTTTRRSRPRASSSPSLRACPAAPTPPRLAWSCPPGSCPPGSPGSSGPTSFTPTAWRHAARCQPAPRRATLRQPGRPPPPPAPKPAGRVIVSNPLGRRLGQAVQAAAATPRPPGPTYATEYGPRAAVASSRPPGPSCPTEFGRLLDSPRRGGFTDRSAARACQLYSSGLVSPGPPPACSSPRRTSPTRPTSPAALEPAGRVFGFNPSATGAPGYQPWRPAPSAPRH